MLSTSVVCLHPKRETFGKFLRERNVWKVHVRKVFVWKLGLILFHRLNQVEQSQFPRSECWSMYRTYCYFQLTKNRVGNDRYTERSMNTFNDLMKNKMTQTTKITHHDASSYATIWDMYDTYSEKQGQFDILLVIKWSHITQWTPPPSFGMLSFETISLNPTKSRREVTDNCRFRNSSRLNFRWLKLYFTT